MHFDIIAYMRNKRLIILLSVFGGIVVLVIVMSAVFTIYHIEALCVSHYSPTQNEEISEVSGQVIEAADDFMYRSIFLFDEEELMEAVDSKVIRAEAVNVECVFPNKIQIDYRYVSDDLQIYNEDDGTYIIAGTSCKITRISEEPIDSSDSPVMTVTPFEKPVSNVPGEYLYSVDSFDRIAMAMLTTYAESLEKPSDAGSKVFRASYDSVDLSRGGGDPSVGGGIIEITMRSGFTFRLECRSDGSFEEGGDLERAVNAMVSSYYAASNSDAVDETGGYAVVHYDRNTGSYRADYGTDS